MASVVLERLRNGVPKTELRSSFEPANWFVYAALVAEVPLAYVLFRWAGFHLAPGIHFSVAFWPFLAIASAMLVRRYGHTRIAGALEACALAALQSVAIYSILIALTVVAAPMADAALARADRMLGFDWPAVVMLLSGHLRFWFVIYRSFDWQPAVVLVILFWLGQERRAWRALTAASIALILTSAIYPFFPAEGAFSHFNMPHAPFAQFGNYPWEFGEAIRLIRDQGDRLVDHRIITGLVSFPSYHAAAGAIFTWAMWATPKLRYPFLALNVLMCMAALMVGGHYFVDLLGGVGVATASIWLAGFAVAMGGKTGNLAPPELFTISKSCAG